ncbi:hypothetical protein L345_06755, partial [Ophiophagus hannah]
MEPWVYLDQRQKALYRDVMQESYETLMSLAANQLLNNSNHEDEDEEDEEEPEGVEELRPGTSQSAPRKVKPLTRRETPKQPKIIPVVKKDKATQRGHALKKSLERRCSDSENPLQEKAIADVLRLWRLQCFFSSCNRTRCYEHGGREEHFRKCLGQWEAHRKVLVEGITSGVYEGPIEKVLTNSSLCYKKERNKDTQKFWIGASIRVPDDYLEESILPFTRCGMPTEEMPTEDWKPGLGGRVELLQTCCDSTHPQHSLKHQTGGLIL